LDPHGWLDPDNAALWLGVIAAELATLDAENAEVYMANAERAVQEIEQLGQRLEAQLAQLKGKHYMVLHDGFQYFDRRFDIEFAGAIALGDASAPSPARIADAREHLSERNVACVFTEPQQNDRLVQVVIEGSDAKTAQLDALGAKLSPGPDLYSQLLQELADSFERCLGA
jgi:zinc transport system substrate-binding protein